MEIVEKLNGVEIQMDENGKYGLADLHNPGVVQFRYRTLDLARRVAMEVAAENDRLDD